MSRLLRRAAIVASAVLVAVSASGLPASARSDAPARTAAAGHAPLAPRRGERRSHLWTFVSPLGPPSTAQCLANIGIACYRPAQLRQAYDMNPLYASTLDGAGTTIAVIDSFGSPTIKRDVAKFDSDFGLDPIHLKVVHPAGAIPGYRPTAERVGWAFESTLDVEWAHVFAPGANILLVETPVNETQGLQGLPQIVKAENYVIDHHLADVISQSFGTSEADFPSHAALRGLRSAFKNAKTNDVTVLASSGDTGATGYNLKSQLFARRAPQWPASDPLVTAVGGTRLHLDGTGNRLSPDSVWNDTFDRNVVGRPPVPTAGGGGLSGVFTRPAYQDSIHAFSANRRGYPDLSLSAAVNGGVLVYLSFGGLHRGYYIVGGTSEASPEFAGVVAIADQAATHDLGFINPMLYQLHATAQPGLVDVTKGNNTVRFRQKGKLHTVTGFTAKTGFDLASGLGTVDGRLIVEELSGT